MISLPFVFGSYILNYEIRKKLGNKMGRAEVGAMPNEMLEKIFSFLPLESKKSARLVCRRWFRILNQDDLILNVVLNDKTISNVKYFTKPHLASLTANKLTQDLSITFDSVAVPPTISKLILQDGISYFHLVKLLEYYTCSNVEQLELHSLSLSGTEPSNIPKFLGSFTNWSYLQTLKLSVRNHTLINKQAVRPHKKITTLQEDEITKHSEAIAQILKLISIPSLTELSLYLDIGFLYPGSVSHPYENIYIQLARFLHNHQNHDKLKILHLKFNGRGFVPSSIRTSTVRNMWSKSMLQLESLQLELLDFNNVEVFGLLSTQRKLKHISVEAVNPSLIEKLFANNSQTLESLCLYGVTNHVSFTHNYTNLKSLSIGFDGMDKLAKFLNPIQQTSSSSTSTTSIFPSLVSFNLIDTHLLIGKFLLQYLTTGRVLPVAYPSGSGSEILIWILNTFRSIQRLRFIIRGDSTHVSEIKSAANRLLEEVHHLKAMSFTISDARHARFTNGMKTRKLYLSHNLMKPLKSTTAGQYYEGGVEVTFEETKSNIFSKLWSSAQTFKS